MFILYFNSIYRWNSISSAVVVLLKKKFFNLHSYSSVRWTPSSFDKQSSLNEKCYFSSPPKTFSFPQRWKVDKNSKSHRTDFLSINIFLVMTEEWHETCYRDFCILPKSSKCYHKMLSFHPHSPLSTKESNSQLFSFPSAFTQRQNDKKFLKMRFHSRHEFSGKNCASWHSQVSIKSLNEAVFELLWMLTLRWLLTTSSEKRDKSTWDECSIIPLRSIRRWFYNLRCE